jgi:hypothetical protein
MPGTTGAPFCAEGVAAATMRRSAKRARFRADFIRFVSYGNRAATRWWVAARRAIGAGGMERRRTSEPVNAAAMAGYSLKAVWVDRSVSRR